MNQVRAHAHSQRSGGGDDSARRAPVQEHAASEDLDALVEQLRMVRSTCCSRSGVWLFKCLCSLQELSQMKENISMAQIERASLKTVRIFALLPHDSVHHLLMRVFFACRRLPMLKRAPTWRRMNSKSCKRCASRAPRPTPQSATCSVICSTGPAGAFRHEDLRPRDGG